MRRASHCSSADCAQCVESIRDGGPWLPHAFLMLTASGCLMLTASGCGGSARRNSGHPCNAADITAYTDLLALAAKLNGASYRVGRLGLTIVA